MRLAALVTILIACSGCDMMKRAVVRSPVVDCGPSQYRYCENPQAKAPNELAATEAEDSVNRWIALECAADHRVLVDCLRATGKAGTIQTAETPEK